MADTEDTNRDKQTILQPIEINATSLNLASSITNNETTDNNNNDDNVNNNDNLEPLPIERQKTWVDGRIMETQTNILIVGYIRTQLVENHYDEYEVEIVQIIIKSLGDIFNMKRLWKEMTQQKYNTLIDWLYLNGAIFQNCQLREVNGIYTTSDQITQSTNFTKIPLKCIITLDIAKNSEIGKKIDLYQISADIKLRSQHTYIASYLVMERKKGRESQWFPYIQSLPSQFNEIPIYFNEREMRELQGSMTIKKTMDRRESLQIEYNNLKEVFNEYAIGYDEFVWGRLIVITRIFGMRFGDYKSSGLVPWVDLIDHAPPAPNRVKWTYDQESGTFNVWANSKMKKGDELFVTYGRKCNSRFLVNYGFILEDENMDNEAVMVFNFKSQEQQDGQREFQFSRLYNQRRVRDTFEFLRGLYFDETDRRIGHGTEGGPVSVQNEKKVLCALREAAVKGLNNFGSSLEFDKELLKNEREYPRKSNKRNIVLMRKGEKEVLVFYNELEKICVSLLEMELDQMKKALQNEEMFEDKKSALWQYIDAVIIPLKLREEKEIERRKEDEIEKQKKEKNAVLSPVYEDEKQQQNESVEVGRKLDIMNNKMEEMSKQIQELLVLNQKKDEQIKLLDDKVNILENKLIELEQEKNDNNKVKQEQNVNHVAITMLDVIINKMEEMNIGNNMNLKEEEKVEYGMKNGDKQMKSNKNKENILSSNVDTLVDFFASDDLCLPQYIHLFMDKGIEDVKGLKGITNDELEKLGITNIEHRKQILNFIQTKLSDSS